MVHKLPFSAKVFYVPLWWPRYTIFRILSNCVAQETPSTVGGGSWFMKLSNTNTSNKVR